MTKPQLWQALNEALVDMRQAHQRGQDDLARKKFGEAMAALEALGRMMRG